MSDATPAITLSYSPPPRGGRGTLTARLGDDVFTDRIDIADARHRQRMQSALAERWSAISDNGSGESLAAELDRLAADEAERRNGRDKPAPAIGGELDLSRIVRSERFITAEVSGVAIPALQPIGGRVAGRWSLALQWADGKRGLRDYALTLDLPDGGRLYLHPEPMEPTPATVTALCGWSAIGRQAWLDGAPPPNPADVFKRVSGRIAHFIDLPDDQAPGITATLALWIMFTYAWPAWPAVPYLYVGGPAGSGKSCVFEVLSRLAFRPLGSSSMTGPALFRTLHGRGGTLLLDEAERLRNASDPAVGELLSMLLAGYKRGGQATRLEPVGDSFKPMNFDVYGPKALACIAGLPPALASRCIHLTMFRAAPDSPKPRRRIDAEPHVWQAIRDDLHALALSNGPTWLDLAGRDDVCPAMSGRDYELWQPLLALALWIERDGTAGLLKLVQNHAQRTIEANRDDQTPDTDEVLLRTLADLLRAGQQPTPSEVLKQAAEGEPDLLNRWSARGVSRVLGRYNLKTRSTNGRRIYGSDLLADVKRIARTYRLDLGVHDE